MNVENGSDSERKTKRWLRPIVALGIGSLLVAGCKINQHIQDPVRAYVDKYTSEGECLDQTPFDPDEGALVHVDQVKGVDNVSVVPMAANAYQPSVLFFSAGQAEPFSSPELVMADFPTGAFLVKNGCPVPPGY